MPNVCFCPIDLFILKLTCKWFGSSNGMEKYICFAHLKQKKKRWGEVCFFLENPLCMYPFACFGRHVPFLSLEKSAQIWPLESHNRLMSYRYPLAAAFQAKISKDPICERSRMWLQGLNGTMLKIMFATYSNCAKVSEGLFSTVCLVTTFLLGPRDLEEE